MNSAPLILTDESTLVIRVATPADREELAVLASLDSASPLRGTVLVAQSDGRIRAAYSVEDDRAVADPFLPTADLVELRSRRAARCSAAAVGPRSCRAGGCGSRPRGPSCHPARAGRAPLRFPPRVRWRGAAGATSVASRNAVRYLCVSSCHSLERRPDDADRRSRTDHHRRVAAAV